MGRRVAAVMAALAVLAMALGVPWRQMEEERCSDAPVRMAAAWDDAALPVTVGRSHSPHAAQASLVPFSSSAFSAAPPRREQFFRRAAETISADRHTPTLRSTEVRLQI